MQNIIVGNHLVGYYGNILKITPTRLLNKHGIQVPNCPIVTRGNQRNDNLLLQQLWNGTVSVGDIFRTSHLK